MKIVSFNVNSIRMRPHQLAAVVEKHAPEFIGLQETKVTDADFPLDMVKELGYEVIYLGQKTHYGVALFTRLPIISTQKGFISDTDEAQKRFVTATCESPYGGEITVMNGYFPQGENQEHPTKYPNKRRFYEDLQSLLESKYSPEDQVIVMGDINISPEDCDIGIGEDNRKRWLRTKKCSFLPEERQWLERLKNWGLTDTFRHIHPDCNDQFSWFDYRSKGFDREPKRGLRIDVIMATQPLLQKCIASGIDYDIRGMEKPSDHSPIWTEFE